MRSRGRLTLTVLYVLATLAAAGWHNHGASPGSTRVDSVGGVTGSLSFADSTAKVDVSDHAHQGCAACDVRAKSAASSPTSATLVVAVSAEMPAQPERYVGEFRSAAYLGRAPPII